MTRKSSSFAVMLLLFSLGIFLPLHAQQLTAWTNLDRLPGRDVVYLWAGDSLFCVEDGRGQLLLSYDNGITWNPTGLEVSNLNVGQAGVLCVLTTANELYYSSDNGRHFSLVVPDIPLQDSLYFLGGSGNYIYLSSRGGTVDCRRSSDGGQTWEKISAPPVSISAFTIAPDGTFYAVVPSANQLAKYTPGNRQWTTISVDVSDNDLLGRISFGLDGRLYGITARRLLYRSEVGGETLVPFAPGAQVSFPFSVNRKGEVYYAVQGSGDQMWRIAAEGNAETEILTPYADSHRSIVFGPNDEVYLLFDDDLRCFRYNHSDTGDTWTSLELPGYGIVKKLTRSSNGTVLTFEAGRAFVSTDGENSFTEPDFPEGFTPTITNLLLTAEGNLLLTASSGIYRSTDRGETWEQVSPTAAIGRLYRSDLGTLYAYAGAVTRRSTDDGMSWTIIDGLSAVQHILTSHGHTYFLTTPSVRYSSDEGQSWSQAGAYSIPLFSDNAVLTPSGTLIAGFGTIDTSSLGHPEYVIEHVGDTGAVVHTLPCVDLNTSYSFGIDPEGHIYLAMSCGLYRSDDEGESWNQIGDTPQGVALTHLIVSGSGTFLLGTNEGLFTAEWIPTGVPYAEAGRAGATIRTLPNPVAGGGEIEFTLAVPSHVRIILYDALGRRVKSLADAEYEAGEHLISRSGLAGLAAGNYHLTIETETGASSQNIIVLSE